MMNPVPWLQMTNMISYQGLVRTFPKRALFVAVVIAPLFAVATYALNPEHQNEYLLFNVVFHYVWVILFCMLVPAAILAAIKKLIGSRGAHG
ncbi:hypothetical protein ACK37A_06570 [Aeromonas veronii]